ncbi:MAG: hypothetical protein ACJ71Q_09120 [Terriglobales bacterium]
MESISETPACAGVTVTAIMSEMQKPEENDYPGKPLPKLPFVAIENRVMCGEVWVCTCRSGNMAERIARALNDHKPSSRGQ